jgi:hypothetical protein
MRGVLGAAIIVAVIVLAIPVTILVSGGVVSAVMGWLLKTNAEQEHEGSELVDLYY